MKIVLIAMVVLVSNGIVGAVDTIAPVAGRVLDDSSGQPVSDARVSLVGTELAVSTDRNGCFAIALPATGRWTLRVSHERFRSATIEAVAVVAPEAADASRAGSLCPAPIAVTIRLQHDTLRLQEHVVVTASRTEDDASGTPRAVSVIDRHALQKRAPRTTPEALADAPGVFLQKTNHGSGAPYVRGLIGNQVLVLIDGVRLNNGTYRYGPNQYLATIDPRLLDRLEVVRGPGSVMFGSDAIGGVVHLITRQPELSGDGLHASVDVEARVMSSDMEESGRVAASLRGRRAAITAGATLQSFGDLVAGGGRGAARPSGYGQVAADAQFLAQATPRQLISLTYQFDRQDDVPRWDQVAQRGYARYSFAPQERQLAYGRWRFFTGRDRLRTLAATVSFQRTRERRDVRRAGSATSTLEQDTVATIGASVEASGAFRPSVSWVMGGESYHDDVGSWRRDTDLTNGAMTARRGLYPDGATAGSAAAFGRATWTRGPWRVEGGARITASSVTASDATFRDVDVAQPSIVGETGLVYQVSPILQVVGNLAQSFRAPNIDDVSTLGRFDFGVEVPSPDLKPERGVTIDGGLRLGTSRAAIRVTAYRTNLHDLIDRVRSTFDGSSLWEGEQVYRKDNVGNAVVRGLESEGEWRVTRSVSVLAHATYTHGQNVTRNEPMRRIPPLNGLARVLWRPSDWWLDGTFRWATAQARLAAGDRDDHRIAPGGTPGWSTLDLSAGRPLGSRLILRGGVSNIFDEAYRTHGSGIDGAGRAAWVVLSARLAR